MYGFFFLILGKDKETRPRKARKIATSKRKARKSKKKQGLEGQGGVTNGVFQTVFLRVGYSGVDQDP